MLPQEGGRASFSLYSCACALELKHFMMLSSQTLLKPDGSMKKLLAFREIYDHELANGYELTSLAHLSQWSQK
ncbi:hypothetical protein CEXT_804471 [Caerostris extrusa]|uniref:Uncharacterized protein n=1 Tax=Caerostris extrusa TaxID=172846 RepID=A0AAV4NY59_CAEEX|nr:hypothetical protein CEXT_804471 [Caerostris extrusa]